MRRLLSILPCLLLLAACDGGPPPISPAQPVMQASFPRGGIADVIKIDTRDALPLRAAELVAPDGTRTPATALDAVRAPRVSGGQQTLKSPWLNSRFDEEPVALPNGADATYRSETQVLVMVSTADIPLPDPVVYRRDWANYRIRLGFDAGNGRLETREIAAPAPPPG
jgi:hypothetical protein